MLLLFIFDIKVKLLCMFGIGVVELELEDVRSRPFDSFLGLDTVPASEEDMSTMGSQCHDSSITQSAGGSCDNGNFFCEVWDVVIRVLVPNGKSFPELWVAQHVTERHGSE